MAKKNDFKELLKVIGLAGCTLDDEAKALELTEQRAKLTRKIQEVKMRRRQECDNVKKA